MAKPKNHRDIKYKQRLKELKEKLKPYRNSQTVNLLRVITGSSGRLLNDHWESLESVLTGQYSAVVVKQTIQDVANSILQNGESTKRVNSNKTIEHSMVSESFIHLRVDSNSDSNVADNVLGNETDGNIDSNVLDNANVTNRLKRLHL